jgi:hypothetical protein
MLMLEYSIYNIDYIDSGGLFFCARRPAIASAACPSSTYAPRRVNYTYDRIRNAINPRVYGGENEFLGGSGPPPRMAGAGAGYACGAVRAGRAKVDGDVIRLKGDGALVEGSHRCVGVHV